MPTPVWILHKQTCTSVGGVWSGEWNEGWKRFAEGCSGKGLVFCRVLASVSRMLGTESNWDWQGRSRWSACAGLVPTPSWNLPLFSLVPPCVTLASLFE